MTGRGWGLLAGSVALYALGTWLGYPELNVLGAAGLLLMVLGLATVAGSTPLEAERRLVPDRATVGEVAEAMVTVTNTGSRRSRAVLGLEPIRPAWLSAGSTPNHVEVAVRRLVPGQAQTLTYRLPTERRTVLDVGRFQVSRGDPFGFIERRSSYGATSRFWVHPRVHPIGPLPLGVDRDLEGPTSESARGDGVFHSLREYVPGDDLRRVHWKATAHRGTLMVREHADPTRPDATVVLDDRAGDRLDSTGFDLAVEVAASAAVVSRRAGFPVQVLSVSGRLRTSAAAGDTALLDLLAGARQHDEDRLAALTESLTTGPGGRALVAVTGRPTPGELGRWALAGRRFGLVVVVAVLPNDAADPGGSADVSGPGVAVDLPPAPAGLTLLPVSNADELVAGWGGLR